MMEELFRTAFQSAVRYRESLPDRPVGVSASPEELNPLLNSDLPEDGESPQAAIQMLMTGVEKGLIHSAGPRYFGFVVGGSSPVSVAADWLTSAWDQNAQVYASSPAASIVEEVVGRWVLELLGLPATAGVGFTTGTQMANFTALSVARNSVLRDHGWNMEADGLQGAPPIQVLCGECCHATIHSAVSMMGLGARNMRVIPADEEGRIRLEVFRGELDGCTGPVIVCVQAGNVNTGAFDPIEEIIALSRKRGAWVHVDGAFGLWAAASPRLAHLVAGVGQADSWATDAHKWLNVPYDSGMVIIRDSDAHRGFKTARCGYAGPQNSAMRDGAQWVPENSRRARGFILYAALRNLGRKGVANMVEQCCGLARMFASELAPIPDLRIINQVVLNQVLFRVEPAGFADLDALNASVASRIQRSGVCWIGTTEWQGKTMLRISVSNSTTTEADVSMSVKSMAQSFREEITRHARMDR
jgi:glutamate/tyrosine decarboxylase-like PLP-dependent enzyme